ncbi:MAG TPA: hypothetical protein VFS11_04240 [Gemmatimonadales bacterium]|nr:hypothetical protein [Gemmatimonadales bacterium]
MTTSSATDDLDHVTVRELVNRANRLPLADRLALIKGLMPGVAAELAPRDYESLVVELRLKGERFYEAVLHPGQGRAMRHVMGERDLEGR